MKTIDSSPKKDHFRMPGEFSAHEGVYMLWPQRPDNWRDGGKPAQRAFAEVARAIANFEPVTMGVNSDQYDNARHMLPEHIRVVEIANNDSWVRDCGPTFVTNSQGKVRGVDWTFNAWGGLEDGLYFPWDQDDQVAQKICEIEWKDRYRLDNFVLEGGSIHVDGEGTLITTEECLLSKGRNPQLSKEQIENIKENQYKDLFEAVSGILSDLSSKVEEISLRQDYLEENMEFMDNDLTDIQDELFEEVSFDDLSSIEDEYVEIKCENCDKPLFVEQQALNNNSSIPCPFCGKRAR